MSTENTLGYTASSLCVISLIPEIYTAYTKQEWALGTCFLFSLLLRHYGSHMKY